MLLQALLWHRQVLWRSQVACKLEKRDETLGKKGFFRGGSGGKIYGLGRVEVFWFFVLVCA